MTVTNDGTIDAGFQSATTNSFTPSGSCVTGSWMIAAIMQSATGATIKPPTGTAVGGSVTIGTGGVITTATAHGLSAGGGVVLAGVATSTGIASGVWYFIISVTSTTMTLSATMNGSALTTTAGTATSVAPTDWMQLGPTTTTGTRTSAYFAKIYNSTTDTVPFVFTSSASGSNHLGVDYGSGSGPVTTWIVGAQQTRATSGGTFTNGAPSLTTTINGAVVVLISTEATSATESAVSSVTNNTQAAFMPQISGSFIESIYFGTLPMSTAGASGAMTVVYPNTQASNGLAVQIGVQPPAGTAVTAAGTSSQSVASTPSMPATVGVTGTSSQTVAAGSNATQTVTNAGTSTITVAATEAQSKSVTIAGTSGQSASTGPVATWLATSPLYVAHFGGDADWPPGLVLNAYQLAARWNKDLAFEVDVWPTTDGVWVVQHDNTTDTNFGTSGNVITSSTWASISGLTTVVGGYPIMRLETLLTAFPTRAMFIDNKGQLNMSALLTLLATYGGSSNFIAKNFCTGTSWADAATAQGYQTWGYYYDADIPTNLPATASHWSMLGMDVVGTSTTADWTALKSYGKKVLAHIIATAAQKATGAGLGADGYMVSGVQEAIPQTPLPLSIAGTSSQSLTAAQKQITSVSATGSSSQTIADAQSFAIALSNTGTGSQSVGLKQAEAIAASISGSGTPSVSVTPRYAAALSNTGSATQTIGATEQLATSVSNSGTGTPSVLAGSNATQSVTNTGTGAQSVSDVMKVSTSVGTTGSGSQSVASGMQVAAAVTNAGVATISVTPSMFLSTSVSNSGAGSVAVLARAVSVVSVTIAGMGSVSSIENAVVNPRHNITVTAAALFPRRWSGSLSGRTVEGSLAGRRWKGSLS